MALHLEGILPALWSPTDSALRLLEPEFQHNLDFLIRRGVHGFMALGSTGEFLHLDPTQKQRLLEIAVEKAAPHPVVANISDIRPSVVLQLGAIARQAGAAAFALLPPYYYPVAQPDLVEFFARAGQAVQLPALLYNFPERTGNKIELETIAAVADRINVAAVKQSGGDFDYHRELVALGREKGFAVLSGSDLRLDEALELGAAGSISGLANAVPELLVGLYHAFRDGNRAETKLTVERLHALGNCINRLLFPLNVAALLEARGLPIGRPKTIISSQTHERYQALVLHLQGLLSEWGLQSF